LLCLDDGPIVIGHGVQCLVQMETAKPVFARTVSMSRKDKSQSRMSKKFSGVRQTLLAPEQLSHRRQTP